MNKDAIRKKGLMRRCKQCYWCNAPLTERPEGASWRDTDATLEHLRPRGHEQRGVSLEMPQTVLACRRCNSLRNQWFEMNVVGIEKLRKKSHGSPPADKEKLIYVINQLRQTCGVLRQGLSRILKMAKHKVDHGQIETVAREFVQLKAKTTTRQQVGGDDQSGRNVTPVSEQIAVRQAQHQHASTCEPVCRSDDDAVRGVIG